MLIDHIAWAFVPTGTILGQVMHTIGRITAPIMSYFISEGFYHTHNVKKICLKTRHICHNFTYPILLFYERPIAISFANGFQFKIQTSVIYTLLLGLISLIIWNSEKVDKKIKNSFDNFNLYYCHTRRLEFYNSTMDIVFWYES